MQGILEPVMLAALISIDIFVVCLAYAGNNIKIPFRSALIITVVCSGVLGICMIAGVIIRHYISDKLTVIICFSMLMLIGIIKLCDSITKAIIRKYNTLSKEISFSLLNFTFILNLYANPEDADIDKSRTLSPMEAVYLAVPVSLDGIAVGFGAALVKTNVALTVASSIVIGFAAIFAGCKLGRKLAQELPFNPSWFSGIVLIILAITKLF